MKLKYIQIAMASALLMTAGACGDNDYTVLDKGSDELVITAGSSAVSYTHLTLPTTSRV